MREAQHKQEMAQEREDAAKRLAEQQELLTKSHQQQGEWRMHHLLCPNPSSSSSIGGSASPLTPLRLLQKYS